MSDQERGFIFLLEPRKKIIAGFIKCHRPTRCFGSEISHPTCNKRGGVWMCIHGCCQCKALGKTEDSIYILDQEKLMRNCRLSNMSCQKWLTHIATDKRVLLISLFCWSHCLTERAVWGKGGKWENHSAQNKSVNNGCSTEVEIRITFSSGSH